LKDFGGRRELGQGESGRDYYTTGRDVERKLGKGGEGPGGEAILETFSTKKPELWY